MTSSDVQIVAADRNRYAWVDTAKGICIVAVVCLYANTYLAQALGQTGWLEVWTKFAKPFRMPDFFLLSGLFLGRVIHRPWRSYLDTKVVHYGYFLVLWTVPYLAWRLFVEAPPELSALKVVKTYIYFLIQPLAMLWFIQMLAIYFVTTRLLRNMPSWLLLTTTAMLSTAQIHSHFAPLEHFAQYYVFFVAGYLFSARIFKWADWAADHRQQAWLLIGAWAVTNAWFVTEGWSLLPVWEMVCGFTAIGAIIALSSLLAGAPWLNWLRDLGHHSIVVYLGFYLPLLWWLAAYRHYGWQIEINLLATLTVLLGVTAAVLFNLITRHSVWAFLFKRPAWAHLRSARPSRLPSTLA
ncbi:MAG: acyltransferase family protein [Leptothrix sp. (in: b-proteobacteria)]